MMAQSIACDLCGDENAVLMQTNLGDGSTVAAGQACLLTLALTSAIAWSNGAEPEEQAVYSQLVAQLVGNLAPSLLQLAQSTKPKPPRRGKAAGQPHTGQEGASGVSGDGLDAGDAQSGSEALSATADS